MTDPRALVEELRAIRVQRNILQSTVARRMGVGRSAVSNFERGAWGDAKLSTVLRYADAIGVRVVVEP